MSIIAPPQPTYDHTTSQEIPPQNTVSINSSVLPPFENLNPSPMASNPPPPSANSAPQIMSITDRTPTALPKLGQTRCYWSLLSPELHFLYLDPVLASHLGPQAEELIGKSLLTYVHPDEQASAERDLGSVLESRTLHGSVTRVRWARISSLRRKLGYQGPDEEYAETQKAGEDPNYMSIDVVINWAADGLVLCFMHAAKDRETRDNDENDKTHWSNWCGTPYLPVEQVQLLYDLLAKRVPPSSALHRVFQVLLNQPERPLWVSWPPDPPLGQGPTSKEFARLAAEVQIGNSASNGTDAKTSCTRRYKALQTMHMGPEGTQEVESIFIPYGHIIFACHRVNHRPTPIVPQSMYGANQQQQQQQQHGPQHYNNSQYYDQSYSVPAVAPPNHNNGYGPPPPSGYPSQAWPSGSESSPAPPPHGHWGPQGAPQAVSTVRSSSYPPPQHQWSSQPPYLENGQTPYSYPPPPGQYPSRGSPAHDPPSPGSDIVPASRIPRRGTRDRDSYANGRSAGNPPTGIGRCASCKVTHSPEWRKGPSGKKDLCNACGLRYARSRAKKEGSAQRRRKDRVLSMVIRDDSPSAVSPGIPYNGGPSGVPYEEGPYSASGSEGYARHPPPPPPLVGAGGPAPPGGMPTPSPDPNFIPYSYAGHNQYTQKQSPSPTASSRQIPPPPPLPTHPQHQHQQHQHQAQTGQAPPPPPAMPTATAPVVPGQQQAQAQGYVGPPPPPPFYSVPPPPPHNGNVHHTSHLPPTSSSPTSASSSSATARLDTLGGSATAYSNARRSPTITTTAGAGGPGAEHASSSPMHSPVSTGFSAASFERERQMDVREQQGLLQQQHQQHQQARERERETRVPHTPESAEPRY